MSKDKTILDQAVQIPFEAPEVWDDLACQLIFGMTGYKIDVEKGTIEMIQPYTKEFDELMFRDNTKEE